MLGGGLSGFYADLRWRGWEKDVQDLKGDRCFNFFPPLWTKEGSVERGDRRPVPVVEMWGLRRTEL